MRNAIHEFSGSRWTTNRTVVGIVRGRTVTLRPLGALLLSGLRSRHTSPSCHAGRCIGRSLVSGAPLLSAKDVKGFMAVFDQIIDAERGSGEDLQEHPRVRECVNVWSEEASQLQASSSSSALAEPSCQPILCWYSTDATIPSGQLHWARHSQHSVIAPPRALR